MVNPRLLRYLRYASREQTWLNYLVKKGLAIKGRVRFSSSYNAAEIIIDTDFIPNVPVERITLQLTPACLSGNLFKDCFGT